MKQAVLSLLFIVSLSFAHAVLLLAEPNDDGTLYIEAGLSTGDVAAGAKLLLREKATGRPLFEGAIPDSGSLNIELPTVPYVIKLNLSDGHSVTKNGPLAVSAKAPKTVEKPSVAVVEEKVAAHSHGNTNMSWLITAAALLIGTLLGFFSFKRK